MKDQLEKMLKAALGKNINVRVIIDGEPMDPSTEPQAMEGDAKEEASESAPFEKREELGMAPEPEAGPSMHKPMPAPEAVSGQEAGRKPMSLQERANAAKIAAQNMLKPKK